MDDECLMLATPAPERGAVVARPDASSPPWQRWFWRCSMTLIVLMICYLGAAWWSMRQDLGAAVRQFSVVTLLWIVGLVSIGLMLRVIRWHYYTTCLSWRLPLASSALAFLASLAFTATPGKAGEAMKLVLLRQRHEIGVSAGVGVLIMERLGDVIAVLILSMASIGLVGRLSGLLLVSVIAIAGAIALVGSRAYESILARLAMVRHFNAVVPRVLRALNACRQLLRPRPLLVGVGLAVLAWSCEAIAFLHLARSIHLELGLLQAFSVYGAATLAGAPSMLPGGLGGFEAVMALLLMQLGFTLATAMPVVVMFRLCTLWFGILIGGLAMFVWFVLFRPDNYQLRLQGGV